MPPARTSGWSRISSARVESCLVPRIGANAGDTHSTFLASPMADLKQLIVMRPIEVDGARAYFTLNAGAALVEMWKATACRASLCIGGRGDLCKAHTYHLFGIGPGQPGHFATVAQKDQRGPEHYADRAPEPTPGAIFDLDVMHARIILQRGGQCRLRGLAVSAPRRAELVHGGAFEGIDLRASRRARRVSGSHGHRTLLISTSGSQLHAFVNQTAVPPLSVCSEGIDHASELAECMYSRDDSTPLEDLRRRRGEKRQERRDE